MRFCLVLGLSVTGAEQQLCLCVALCAIGVVGVMCIGCAAVCVVFFVLGLQSERCSGTFSGSVALWCLLHTSHVHVGLLLGVFLSALF